MQHFKWSWAVAWLMFLPGIIIGCRNGSGEDPRQFIGRRIVLPIEEVQWIQNQPTLDSINYLSTDPLQNGRATILAYFDSRGCTSCRLKELALWRGVLSRIESDSLPLNVLFVFRTSADDPELVDALKKYRINAPILCDPEGSFENVNPMPRNELLHTFLLDSDGIIRMLGSPLYNPRMWDAYRISIMT